MLVAHLTARASAAAGSCSVTTRNAAKQRTGHNETLDQTVACMRYLGSKTKNQDLRLPALGWLMKVKLVVV